MLDMRYVYFHSLLIEILRPVILYTQDFIEFYISSIMLYQYNATNMIGMLYYSNSGRGNSTLTFNPEGLGFESGPARLDQDKLC